MNRILLIAEVSELLRVSESTINRWMVESRKGENTFPLPVSARGGKRRWTRDSIEAFIDSQTIAARQFLPGNSVVQQELFYNDGTKFQGTKTAYEFANKFHRIFPTGESFVRIKVKALLVFTLWRSTCPSIPLRPFPVP